MIDIKNKKNSLVIISFSVLFSLLVILVFFYYKIAIFPYEWEPTDGDHLNFAYRLFELRPIYFPIKSGTILSNYPPFFHLLLGFGSLFLTAL